MKISHKLIDPDLVICWSEISWAYEHGILGTIDVLELAKSSSEIGCDDAIFELSMLEANDDVEIKNALQSISSRSRLRQRFDPRGIWIFVALSWLYQHMEDFNNPMGEVEIIYADFDYPEEIAPFVRYMPPSDGYSPEKHTAEENKLRLLENWRRYLETKKLDFLR